MLGWIIAAVVYAAGIAWMAHTIYRAPVREDFADYDSEHLFRPDLTDEALARARQWQEGA